MTVLNAQGKVVEQSWHYVEMVNGHVSLDLAILSLADLQSSFQETDHHSLSRIGVRITVDDDLEEISSYLQHLGLIDLVFPHFKDGRPFSSAVTLRRDYHFSKELRASGDILPDQALFLIRCGFSSFLVPAHFSNKQFKTSLEAYSVAYQPMNHGDVDLVGDVRKALA